MYLNVLALFLVLLYNRLKYLVEARKSVHQTDISEYCKRRVAASMFLGQRVKDAHSHVVQFSQLDVPYSCSLSVRAESGTNIILVVQLQSEENLFEACTLNGQQLVVYEFGETFGGYWGLIPDAMVHKNVKNYTRFYTLRTPKPPTRRTRTNIQTSEYILTQTETRSTVEEQQYYTIDVPIVNVSGNFQLGPSRQTHDSEELFDFIYDVTPRNGVEYETSIMPLVQFSIRPQGTSYEGEDERYELDYRMKGFTMDPRLTFNTGKRKKTSRRRDWKAKKIFHRTKSTAMFLRRDAASYKKLLKDKSQSNNKTIPIPTLDSKYFTNSWQQLDDIMKSINTSAINGVTFKNESFRDILNIISNTQHNSSVYLAPNISLYNKAISTNGDNKINPKTTVSNLLNVNTSTIGLESSELDTSKKPLQNLEPNPDGRTLSEFNTDIETKEVETEVPVTETLGNKSLEAIQNDDENLISNLIRTNAPAKENETVPSTSKSDTYNPTRRSFPTGALVDHESWENIVQVAPEMAVVLNKTDKSTNNTNNNVIKERKKRHIQSLEVDISHPRNLTRTPLAVTNTPPPDDVQQLARIVELQDDEIGSRVALRYLRHYVGPALFNLCDYHESNVRQIFLFNSSRIVITVNNFTLDRMNLVLTPAQTLSSGVPRCPPEQLECQIVGTRVCIDSLNACDNIPNCGSLEIYDEDRLTCGTSHGVQHNVYLAALTFLAVILTSLFIAKYWLKRCVPRVSDAFFVYTESSENELFLDTVMRSPNDNEDPFNKPFYPGHYFEDDVLYEDIHMKETKGNFCKKIIKICLRFLLCKTALARKLSQDLISTDHAKKKELSKMFSFTQLELRKIAKPDYVETGIQTSQDIEMMELDHQENKKDSYILPSWMKFKTDSARHDSELNLIKFSKESRLLSQNDSIIIKNAVISDEKSVEMDRELEIKNTIYDQPKQTNKIPVTCEIHSETKAMIESKHLRFDEQLQMIPSIENESMATTSTVQRLQDEDLDKIEEHEEQEPESFGRDFMRFWGAKGKKSRKKKHLPLHL